MERGIKRVPRKIEDFSGCFKGVRLINNLKLGSLLLYRAFLKRLEGYT